MFDTDNISPLFAPRGHDQALAVWRRSADLVAARWRAFLEADAETRLGAFAAYVAALDAEEAAAVDLASQTFRMAA